MCVSHWAREELTPNSLRRETPGKVHGAYRRTEWPFRWFRRVAFPSSGASLLGGQFPFIFTVLPPGKPHSGALGLRSHCRLNRALRGGCGCLQETLLAAFVLRNRLPKNVLTLLI